MFPSKKLYSILAKNCLNKRNTDAKSDIIFFGGESIYSLACVTSEGKRHVNSPPMNLFWESFSCSPFDHCLRVPSRNFSGRSLAVLGPDTSCWCLTSRNHCCQDIIMNGDLCPTNVGSRQSGCSTDVCSLAKRDHCSLGGKNRASVRGHPRYTIWGAPFCPHFTVLFFCVGVMLLM